MNKRLSCTLCNGEYYDKSTLNRHIRTCKHYSIQPKMNDNVMSISQQQMRGSEELNDDADKYDYNLIYELSKLMKMHNPNSIFDDAIRAVIKYGSDHFNRQQPHAILPTPKVVDTCNKGRNFLTVKNRESDTVEESRDKKNKDRKRPRIKWQKL